LTDATVIKAKRCAGGGTLLAEVIAGQVVDIQLAVNCVSYVGLRYQGRLACGKDLFSTSIGVLVNG
jgi:hypothetical protein